NSATGVPLNAVIEVSYSGALDPATVTATTTLLRRNSDNATIAMTPSLDSTGTVIRLTPTAALSASTGYCFFIQTGVKGTNGKPASTFNACFTTGTTAQTTAPTVAGVSPADQLANVPVNTNIRVLFSGPIDPLTVNGTTVQLSAGGVAITSAVSFTAAAPQSGALAPVISFGSGNQAVVITPENPLPPSTVLTLTVAGVKDLAGNVVPTSTTHFTTGTGPQTFGASVVSTNPPANATNVPLNVAVSLQTNAPVDITTVSTGTFSVFDTVLNQNVAGNYSISADGQIAYFVPSGPLATGRTYTVSFNQRGMTDLLGNLLTACCGANDFSFTTGVASSTTGPTVTGVSPASGLTQVPINARVMIQFNEPVDSQTLGQVTLSRGGVAVKVTSSLANGNQMMILVPLTALSPNTTYTLNIIGVTDLSGVKPINPPVTSTFTTGSSVDFSVPQVVAVFPANGATAVTTTNATVQIQFNKPMNPLTITNSSFTVSKSGTPLAGTIAVAPDARSATFTPSIALVPATAYNIQTNSGITDLAGQGLTSFQSSFTTGN
ncbi:MAG: Ig-like domain-containing protein, partial [Bryobacteraceae bacterium]